MLLLGDIVSSRSKSTYASRPADWAFCHRKAHNAAAFLAWPRYFIHVYEKALQEQCHYEGYLT